MAAVGQLTADTRIAGVSNALIRKGRNARNDMYVPQVNIDQALQWMRQASDVQTNAYREGLTYYTDALKSAAKEIKLGYKQANQTLQPMSYAANQALNEQLRFMGLDPLSSSVNMLQEAKDRGLPKTVQDQIAAAEKIKDPAQRATALNNLNNTISAGVADNTTKIATLSEQLAKNNNITSQQAEAYRLSKLLKTNRVGETYLPQEFYGELAKAGIETTGIQKIQGNYVVSRDQQAIIMNALMKAKVQGDARLAAEKDINAQIASLNDANTAYNQFGTDYNQAYSANYDGGYTGDQVTAKLEATPGYKFQLDQGTKAIERQGAAKGMLGSGNTLTALTQYGQGLAQNFYGMYMDNLSRIVAEGSPATMQIAANKVTEGTQYANLESARGAAGRDTYGLIGTAQANSLYNQANAYSDAAKFNAGMQYQGISQTRALQAGMASAALQAGPGYQAQALAQQKFNYGVMQNQQGGQQFYA
jgi:hypothetical protein